MASVQMSQTLRDQITDNYRVQLEKAFRKSHNVQPAIDSIVHEITRKDSDFATLCKLQEDYHDMLAKVKATYKDYSKSSYGSSRICDNITETSVELGIVCNPNRPAADHMCMLDDWNEPYVDNSYGQENTERPGSTNYVEGDIAVALKDLTPFYQPVQTRVEYEKGWYQNRQYAPHASSAWLITDPELCEMLSPIGFIEAQVATNLEKFVGFIDKVTTLKRFIDEWPGGKELVPSEYMERMLTKKTPSSPANRLTPEQIIPDELKEQMNEVILTNKLLGD
jgi:hypothetical protein